MNPRCCDPECIQPAVCQETDGDRGKTKGYWCFHHIPKDCTDFEGYVNVVHKQGQEGAMFTIKPMWR